MNKIKTIKLRVTEREREAYFKMANELNLSVSGLIRLRMKQTQPLGFDFKSKFYKDVSEKLTFLGNMGNNLNQLTQLYHLIKKGFKNPDNEGKQLLELLSKNKEELQNLYKIFNELNYIISKK